MKKVLTICAVLCMLVSPAVAGTIKCTVKAIIAPNVPENGNSVFLKCMDLKDMKIGDNVKVKIPKSKTAIEGC